MQVFRIADYPEAITRSHTQRNARFASIGTAGGHGSDPSLYGDGVLIRENPRKAKSTDSSRARSFNEEKKIVDSAIRRVDAYTLYLRI